MRSLYPGALWRVRTNEKKVYLTFDDGPVPGVTTEALFVLKRYDVKATFFCVGDNVYKHPEIYRQIVEEGHTTGNHTFHHADGWKYPARAYLRDISKCAEVFSTTLFRPPYGHMKKAVFNALKRKYKVVMWDVLTCDYDKSISGEQCLQNALNYSRNGSVVVFHDSLKAADRMLYALPRYIEAMKNKGFEFAVIESDSMEN
ncbi:MAG: polysaccharide deacetylase family protein [Bacteroidia bacterium]